MFEQPPRHDAAALQNELGFRAHEDGTNLEHPLAGRQARRTPQASRSTRMNSAFGNGFGAATFTIPLDRRARSASEPPHEVLVVNPRHELPAMTGTAAEAVACQPEERVEDAAAIRTQGHR